KPSHAPQTLYACDAKSQCTGRNQARVDELVTAVVAGRLAAPDALSWLSGADDERAQELEAEAEKQRRRLAQVEADYDDDLIDARRYKTKREKSLAALEKIKAERGRHLTGVDPELLTKVAGPQAHESLRMLTASQQHDLLLALGVRVKIDRAGRGPVFRP